MALAGDPDMLIADETDHGTRCHYPSANLQLLATLQRQRGMALLLITHDLGVAAQMADRIAVMYAGQIVEQAPREAFFQNADASLYTNAVPRQTGSGTTRQMLVAIPGRRRFACNWLSICGAL